MTLLRDLRAHKEWADTVLINAVALNTATRDDAEIRALLHHILLANRFWLLTLIGVPFVFEHESRPFTSFDDLITRYRETQVQERLWLAAASERELARTIDSPLIPGTACTVAQALTQVCLHAHGHRAQIAKLLRRHGGVPPMTDYIIWLMDRPTAEWCADRAETSSS